MPSRDDNAIPIPTPPQGEPHPRIARMIDYWRELAPGPGLVPGLKHFDPMRVPDLLPNLWLLDVVREDGRLRYRFRLVGDALIDAGAPFRKGLFVDELGDQVDQAAAHAVHDGLVGSLQPDWRRGRPIVKHLRFIALLERVLLPLAADGRTVDHILAMTIFYQMDGRVI
jgi:hypothetical protein